MNSGLTFYYLIAHTKAGPRFKVSSERPGKRGIKPATLGLVAVGHIHYTTVVTLILDKNVSANSLDPDQTAREQSDLGLHCLPIRKKRVKQIT